MNNNNVTYFDSFGVEHIPKEIKAFINRPLSSASRNKNIKTNIFRVQEYDLVMCGYFCNGFIDFMFKGKNLTESKIFFHQITLRRMMTYFYLILKNE